jgi:hypothetical protein
MKEQRCQNCVFYKETSRAYRRWVDRHCEESVAMPAAGVCEYPMPEPLQFIPVSSVAGTKCKVYKEK